MIKAERQERVLRLSLDVPPVNVLDTATLAELSEHLTEAASDSTLSAILLSGEGKCFSAGASVEEHREEQVSAMLSALTGACMALTNAPVPTVALVHASCLGGALELVSFCDFVIADPSATFGVPEIRLAFFPPLACYQLARLCGRQNAAHLVFTGDTVDAERARELGLVQAISPREEWEKVASRFNRLSSPVVRLAKQALLQGAGKADEKVLSGLNDLFIQSLYQTEDVFEGISSFTEKRKPQWKHR